MVSRGLENIVDELVDLVNTQDLIGRVTNAMRAYWRSAIPRDIDPAFSLEEVRPELGAQMLCFRGDPTNARAPYVATNLQLYVLGYRVGWYELLTTLEGETISEDGAILEDYYAEGRSAALIKKVRERAVGDRQEWVGLVELRATPGNQFLPDWAIGGFTTAVALAANENEYRQRVTDFFTDKGVQVEELEEVEPLPQRLRGRPAADNELLELAVALSDSLPVAHTSTIYSYGSETGDGGAQ
jgi:hypothetical protein